MQEAVRRNAVSGLLEILCVRNLTTAVRVIGLCIITGAAGSLLTGVALSADDDNGAALADAAGTSTLDPNEAKLDPNQEKATPSSPAEDRLAEAMGLKSNSTQTTADPSATPHPHPDHYPIGERLVYVASVKKAGVSAEVGEAVFTVTETNGRPVITATAQGEKLGYSIDTEITTVLDSTTLLPVSHSLHQTGSESRDKKLIFSKEGAVYWKVKHCRDKRCQDPDHMVKATNWVGFIPWGTKKAHCGKKHCDNPAHTRWRERKTHMFDEPYRDMLSALYEARSLDFESDEPKTIAVVNDRDRWNVRLVVKEETKLKVKAGTFDAVRIVLEPVASEARSRSKKFEGLFGLHGSISVWLDKETRRPLRVAGIVPIGPIDIDANVELAEVGQVAAEAKPAANSKPEGSPSETSSSRESSMNKKLVTPESSQSGAHSEPSVSGK